MGTKLSLSDLRIRMTVRLAVAPRRLLKTLWTPKSRPHERDAAREQLVEFITEGWESLDIDATAPDGPSGAMPYSAKGIIGQGRSD